MKIGKIVDSVQNCFQTAAKKQVLRAVENAGNIQRGKYWANSNMNAGGKHLLKTAVADRQPFYFIKGVIAAIIKNNKK